MNLRDWMLKEHRRFVIDIVKAPLYQAIILAASLLPEPTKENTERPNTHRLLDMEAKFFGHEDNPNRTKLYRAAWKIFIAEYEHDPAITYRLDYIFEEQAKSGWEPRPPGHPDRYWKE